MTKLPVYYLNHNKKADNWKLETKSGQAIKDFENKADATKGGALSKAIGPQGGSVKIRTMDGRIQEERTFPRSADPKKSPG